MMPHSNKKNSILLINPGGSSPVAPPPGIMALYSYIKKAGFEAVQLDINAEIVHYLLNPFMAEKHLKSSQKKRLYLKCKETYNLIKAILFRSKRSLNLSRRYRYQRNKLKHIHSEKYAILDHIKSLWSENGFIDLDNDFAARARSIEKLFMLYSITISSWCVNFAKAMIPANLQRLGRDPFSSLYEKKIIPEIRRINPDIIGISLTYLSQIPYTITFLQCLKNNGIRAKIVTGGSAFTNFCRSLKEEKQTGNENAHLTEQRIRLFLRPYGIQDEGELAFFHFCNSSTKDEIVKTPNLVYVDENDQLQFNRISRALEAMEFASIDPKGFPIKRKYLTPLPYIQMNTSRGCYWGKCAFCDESAGVYMKDTWRESSPERVVENIEYLTYKYGIRYINFCDKAMSPRMIKTMSQKLIERGISIRWGSMVRCDEALLKHIPIAALAGCAFLAIGLESGCQRVLDRMNKGYKLDTVREFLDICRTSGIKVHVSVIFGFPGEEMAEAQQTIKFLAKYNNAVFTLMSNQFTALSGSSVIRKKEEFGISVQDKDQSGFMYRKYHVDHGISWQEAKRLHRSFQIDHRFRNKSILNQREMLPDEIRLFANEDSAVL